MEVASALETSGDKFVGDKGGAVGRVGAGQQGGGPLQAGTNFDVFLAFEQMDLVENIQQIQRILEEINERSARAITNTILVTILVVGDPALVTEDLTRLGPVEIIEVR